MAKVLALALALCRALSVSAFAAVDGGAEKTAEKIVDILFEELIDTLEVDELPDGLPIIKGANDNND